MGIDCFDIPDLRPRHTQKTMLYLNDLFAYDIILKFHQQVVDLTNNTGRGIFNGKYGKIRTALIDR